jgi:hypothetical protein
MKKPVWASAIRVFGIYLSIFVLLAVVRANPIPILPTGYGTFPGDSWYYLLHVGFGLMFEYLIYRWLMRPKGITATRSATVFALTHLITWPLTVFAAIYLGSRMFYHGYITDLMGSVTAGDCLAELVPVLAEAVVYCYCLRAGDQRVTWSRAFLMSTIANLVSFGFGSLMARWSWTALYVPWRPW